MNQSYETSQEMDKLFAALAKAQAELEPAIKSETNPAFARGASKGSKYADLAGCMKVIKVALPKHGLCLSQVPAGSAIVTTLGHESGQWMRSAVQIPNFENLTPQQIGSATTYFRRYSLGIVGLVSDEDDDGNAASEESQSKNRVDPRGDGWKKVDMKVANKYVSLLMDAIDKDKPEAVKVLSDELSQDPDLKIAVWHVLSKPIRDKIRDILDQKEAA